MKKFILCQFLLFLLLFSPKEASAYFYDNLTGQGSFSDLVFSVHTFDPDDTANSEYPNIKGRMSINITSGGGAGRFAVGNSYSISIWHDGMAENQCYSMSGGITSSRNPYTATTQASSPNELNFTIDFLSSRIICTEEPGKFNLVLWSGNTAKSSDSVILGPTSIYIDQKNLGSFDLKPFSSDPNANLICPGRKPAVALIGSKKGNRYTFWWDGAKKTAFQVDGTDEPSTTVEVEPSTRTDPTQYKLCMEPDGWGLPILNFCRYSVTFTLPSDPVKQCAALAGQQTCNVTPSAPRAGEAKYVANAVGENYVGGQGYWIDLLDKQNGSNVVSNKIFTADANGRMNVSLGEFPAGNYGMYVYTADGATRTCTNENVVISSEAGAATAALPKPAAASIDFKPTTCTGPDDENCARASGDYCDAARTQLRTAIGCVPVDPATFIAGAMRYITGFSGGIALLLMIFGAFQMMTSGGNAETLKKGREQFVSAIIGLLFVIFAVLLLQIIGVDLLGLPGFKK